MVWLQGSQSTTTGGASSRKRKPADIIAWFAHSIRCVLITALGDPVEPDVNRNLAMVSGPTVAWAWSTACDGSALSSENRVLRVGSGFRPTTTSTSPVSAALT